MENDIIKKSVIYSGALDWNSLDSETRNIKLLDSETRNIKELIQFKRVQKAWMLNTYMVRSSKIKQ